jgi:hypothetical protein
MRGDRRSRSALALVVLGAAIAACSTIQPSTSVAPTPTVVVADLETIRADIEQTYAGQFVGIGIGPGVVSIAFQSTALEAARAVVAKYGPAVQVSVGLFPFPAPPGALPNPCVKILATHTIEDPGPLRARIEMPAQIAHGFFKANVRVVNTGPEAVGLTSGQPAIVTLYRPAEVQPIGGFAGGIGGTGLELILQPGGSTVIPAVGGTASCDLAVGYEIPDGQYVARAAVENGLGPIVPAFVTEPFLVTVATTP